MYNLRFLHFILFLAHSIDDDSLYFYHIFKSPKIDLITCIQRTLPDLFFLTP